LLCAATSVKGIDKQASLSYDVYMINKIKNKYETYTPGEFLPIYYDGRLANKKEFHLYKLKKVGLAIDRAFVRAYGK